MTHDRCVRNRQLSDADIKKAKKHFTQEYYFRTHPTPGPGAPKTPETLTDTLKQRLRPKKRLELADQLINLALKGPPHVSFRAIEYIYDRLEGRPVILTQVEKEQDSTLAKILEELAKDPELNAEDIKLLQSGIQEEAWSEIS